MPYVCELRRLTFVTSSTPECHLTRLTVRIVACYTESGKISSSSGAPIIPIEEYRKIVEDGESSDEKVLERLQFLEAFFRNIICMEIEQYVREK